MSLCEVGSPAHRFALPPTAFHAWASEHQQVYPHAMTCLTTHDTKRSEDVRAVLNTLSEVAPQWDSLLSTLRESTAAYRGSAVDGRIENLWWQTLVGTSSPSEFLAWERLEGYLVKAMREAKTFTTWTSVSPEYEASVLEYARRCYDDDEVSEAVLSFRAQIQPGVRATTLGMKVLQLTCPGVPDTYQGNESLAPSLVDPDNRRPVDFADLAARLAHLDAGARARTLADEKLWVTAQTLRARRSHAAAVIGPAAGYSPLPASTGNAVVFARTQDGAPRLVSVVTRNALELESLGGWADHTVALPAGRWTDVMTGTTVDGGSIALSALLSDLPVAVLESA